MHLVVLTSLIVSAAVGLSVPESHPKETTAAGKKAGPTMKLSDLDLPVIDTLPQEDGVYAIKAGSPLAVELLKRSYSRTDKEEQWKEYDANRLARRRGKRTSLLGLPDYLVRVERDKSGKFFLIQECGIYNYDTYLVKGGNVFTRVQAQQWRLPIMSIRRKDGTIVVHVDAEHTLRDVPPEHRFRPLSVPGLWVLTVGNEFGEPYSLFMMTLEAASKLDMVINYCEEMKEPPINFEALPYQPGELEPPAPAQPPPRADRGRPSP